jgi:glycosyltransferase involved in cell wall biosynthesis
MKVIHVPFGFPPDPVGGTEVYVSQLARDLNSLGVEAVVAAPAERKLSYSIDGLDVRRFAFTQDVVDPAELYGLGDAKAAKEFAEILDEQQPNLVHLHALTFAISVRLIRMATKRRIPVVLTYHTPTVSCQRGTMMLWGKYFCDGRLAVLLGHTPPQLGAWLRHLGLRGGVWTALRTTELMKARHDAFGTMVSEVTRIVAVCGWVQDVLRSNGVSSNKIVLSRHGINWTPSPSSPIWADGDQDNSSIADDTRIVFVGRLERVKGLHVLISALKMNPDLKIKLDVFGIVQNESQLAYREELAALIGADTRISFHDPLPSSNVVERLRHYDFLAVPSQWIETGPLVVLEAFAAGIPVIGWNIGGVGELVRHEVDGLLIAPGSDGVIQWGETLRRVSENPQVRARLKAGVRPPRKSMKAALEMREMYLAIMTEIAQTS